MKNTRYLAALAAFLLIGALATDAAAKGKRAPTKPGTYTDWNGDLDRIEIVQTFSLDDFEGLLVGAFETEDVVLPDPDDNSYEPAVRVLADVESPLIQGLRKELSRLKVKRADGEPAAGDLLLRGRVVEMDPGSRAARYWGGFGAGAARAKISGEVVDGGSGEVLLRFTQERRSGVGVGGGNYVNLMNRSLRAIGKDLGVGLEQF
ncbi:MAG: DUF4410 domain-containing protein [Acidobacteriota bacterium]